MNVRLLRGHSAAWLIAPVIVLTIAYTTQVVLPFMGNGDWMSVFTRVGPVIGLILPVSALSAAWEGWRFATGELSKRVRLRSLAAVHLSFLWPSVALGLTALLVTILVASTQAMGAPFRAPWGVLALYIALVIANCFFGYALGLYLRRVIALPLALVAPYLWIGLPGAFSDGWIRQLNGFAIWQCCFVDQEVSFAAFMSPLLWGVAGVVLFGTAIFWPSTRFFMRGAGVAVSLLAASIAISVAVPAGLNVAQARSGEPECAGAEPVICLWPEQRAGASFSYDVVLTEAYRSLQRRGIVVPERISADSRVRGSGDATFVSPMPRTPSETDVLITYATGFVPEESECIIRADYDVVGVVVGWYARAMGVTDMELSNSLGPDVVLAVDALGEEQGQEWVDVASRSLVDCSTPTPLSPLAD